MEKACFFVGALIGGVIGIITFELILTQNPKDSDSVQDYNPIIYLEKAESYENKKETSFKVCKVLSDGALMREISDKENGGILGKLSLFMGNISITTKLLWSRTLRGLARTDIPQVKIRI